MATWKDWKDKLQTGDVLLFHHDDDFHHGFVDGFLSIFNDLIGWATKSKYTHSAIVVRDPQFTSPPLSGLYVLESSYETFPDSENHESKLGVALNSFDKIMEDWAGEVYCRRLHCTRDQIFLDRLAETHSLVHNRPYDLDPIDWVKAEFEIKSKNPKDSQLKKRFWCSALVGCAYVKWGFLPADTPWSLLAPKSFGTESGDQIPLVFQNCTLDSEVRIK